MAEQNQDNLGNLTSGGTLALGHVVSATLRSEPGFEPSFTGDFLYGEDYLTLNPSDGVSHPSLSGIIVPDDGSTPFQMQVTGIQYPDPTIEAIVGSNKTKGLAVPYGAVYSGKMTQRNNRLPEVTFSQFGLRPSAAETQGMQSCRTAYSLEVRP
jgi:hypothetical protein